MRFTRHWTITETTCQVVNEVVSSCYYHNRRQRQVSHCVGQDVMKQLASAFILSRLDYCNSTLAGVPTSTIATLQRVQMRTLLNLHPRDSIISDGLCQLHWLPIESRIQFKVCLIMHLIHTGRCPSSASATLGVFHARHTRVWRAWKTRGVATLGVFTRVWRVFA